ncbi:hypothetical protein [Streptomyces africanus]|uniref:hypothetical protein n=1 Tax=Streptomyces africanus TaxID=231024 RepID=UPI001FC90204|nr:hypothetical protein [Streptomyces africanus]
MRRFGHAVEPPIDPFNRPRHRGEFGLRVPPSQTAMQDVFGRWREDLPGARMYLVACRDYVMTKIACLSGVRANELCGVCMGDLHREHGHWGRFVVLGSSDTPGPPRHFGTWRPRTPNRSTRIWPPVPGRPHDWW